MALKDWKKLREDKRKFVYSKDGGKTGLMVYPDSKLIGGKYKPYKWTLLKQTAKRNFFRSFKTRLQAVRAAKLYMMKH